MKLLFVSSFITLLCLPCLPAIAGDSGTTTSSKKALVEDNASTLSASAKKKRTEEEKKKKKKKAKEMDSKEADLQEHPGLDSEVYDYPLENEDKYVDDTQDSDSDS